MKISKRSSKALKIVLRFSIFILSLKKAATITDEDLEFLLVAGNELEKTTPKTLKKLEQLEKKYLKEAKA